MKKPAYGDNNESRVTVYDIARELGLSASTVSKALKGIGRISKETCERVRNEADRVGYQPSIIASSLATQRTSTIGIITPTLGDTAFSAIVYGAESVARANGCNVIVCCTHDDPEFQSQDIELLCRRRVEGVIFASSIDEQNASSAIAPVLRLEEQGVPVVILENVPDHRLTRVTIDNFNGAKVMIEHLISIGHRRIGLVHYADDSISSHDMLRGYKAAIKEAGLPSEESLIGLITHDRGIYNRETVDEMFARYMETAGHPTAVFAKFDMLAIKVLQACHNLGLRVPEDVAVVGYGDIMMSEHTIPPLTTVHVPGAEMGERAAEILFRRINGNLKHHVHESIMGSLVIRKSCGTGVLNANVLSCRSQL